MADSNVFGVTHLMHSSIAEHRSNGDQPPLQQLNAEIALAAYIAIIVATYFMSYQPIYASNYAPS